MSDQSLLIIVPAFNAARRIEELVDRLRKHISMDELVIVDDGSVDDTARLAEASGATVISHPRNLGKGAALKTGFRIAQRRGYEYVLTMDADLQHPPEYVPQFIELVRSGKFDMVIGARARTEDMPQHRVFANFATSIIISLFAGVRIRDSQSGFRLISTKLINAIHLRGDKYDLESEILLKAAHAGFRIGEIEVPTVYEGSHSFINPFVDGCRFLRILCESHFW